MTTIRLKGVCENNLKSIDLEIPQHQALTICGVSGSGKTSLAFDTLYAEGRRRFIETLSPRIRQNLEKLDRPDAELIENVPASIAVRAFRNSSNQRLTVGIVTELEFFLRKLFVVASDVVCFQCGQQLGQTSPGETANWLESITANTRYMIGFDCPIASGNDLKEAISTLRATGFVRAIVDGKMSRLEAIEIKSKSDSVSLSVIVDRLTSGNSDRKRIIDSISTAQRSGNNGYWIITEPFDRSDQTTHPHFESNIDGKPWLRFDFSERMTCTNCQLDFPRPDTNIFNWNNHSAACSHCTGEGHTLEPSESLIVPDKRKTINDAAFALFAQKPFASFKPSFEKFADSNGIDRGLRFFELTDSQKELLWSGQEGILSIFEQVRLNENAANWRKAQSWMRRKICSQCHGFRLNPMSLSYRLDGAHYGQWTSLNVAGLSERLNSLNQNEFLTTHASAELTAIQSRLEYLRSVGLEYLSLDRPVNTLSSGEAQRVSMTVSLASTLVNALYVLDEPTVGLHATDCPIILNSIDCLRKRGNTVVVVEHNEQVIRNSHRVVEIGPAAGERGGKIVYDGDPPGLLLTKSTTADFLVGRRGIVHFERSVRKPKGQLQLVGATGNNLKNIDVTFPLGVLCAVTGVSGAGKTSLVCQTLYGAIGNRIGQKCPQPLPHQQLTGVGQIDEVVLIDHSPVGKSPRSNPATYIKAFDEIRRVFSETIDAKTANIPPGHFSFNVDGGRCPHCEGDGQLSVDMQFMADIKITCEACQGKRFRKEVLAVRYRGKSIADVLDMNAREAMAFFRGQTKLQSKLKSLVDVGLDYMTLGQGAHTLSAGESQRLKLAAYLGSTRRNKTLFILDEPTSGLHAADVVTLLDCLSAILAVGHSMIVADHNLRLIASADHVIELGPGSADNGGNVVFTGPPADLVKQTDIKTGLALNELIQLQ